MAVIALCGFEGGRLTNSYADLFQSIGGTCSIQTSVKRSGAYAFRSNPTTTAAGWLTIYGISSTNSGLANLNVATLYARFYFRYATAPASSDEPIITFRDNVDSNKIELRLNSSGNLVLYVSGTSLLGTGSTTLSSDTWYRIELMQGTGTNAPYELRVIVCDGSGVDPGTTQSPAELSGTATTSSTNHGRMTVGKHFNRNGQTVDLYYDDLLVRSDDWCGAGSIVRLAPNANGSTMQWTAGTGSSDYSTVDEIPYSVADYIKSTAAGDVALMDFESSATAGISGTINGVLLNVLLAEDAAGTSAVAVRIRSGSTNSDSTAAEAVSAGSTAGMWRLLDVDPDTATAWTTSGIDGIEGGIVEDGGSGVRVRCYGMRIDVDFTVAGGGGSSVALSGSAATPGAGTHYPEFSIPL